MKLKIINFFSKPAVPSLIIGFLVTGVAMAQQVTGAPTIATTYDNLGSNLICPVIDVMFWGLISISIIIVLWAAYLYVIAGDDAGKTSEARKIVLYAAIAIVIALVAKGFPLIVSNLFPGGSLNNPWACPAG